MCKFCIAWISKHPFQSFEKLLNAFCFPTATYSSKVYYKPILSNSDKKLDFYQGTSDKKLYIVLRGWLWSRLIRFDRILSKQLFLAPDETYRNWSNFAETSGFIPRSKSRRSKKQACLVVSVMGGGRPSSGILSSADPNVSPFVLFWDIHFWLTDTKKFLGCLWWQYWLNLRGKRAKKIRN